MKITKQSNGQIIVFPTGSDLTVQCDISAIGEAGNFKRTVNAALVNLSDPLFKKYEISISATGLKLPSINHLWEGDILVVEAPITLREMGVTPSRPAVSGTLVSRDGYIEYQPIFTVMLTGKSQNNAHRKASVSWALQLEEV